MAKSKQPEFKVGEVLKKGIQLFTIEKVVDEPTLTINDYASGTTLVITRTEARRDYDLFSRKAKTGHPFRQKKLVTSIEDTPPELFPEAVPPESTANRPIENLPPEAYLENPIIKLVDARPEQANKPTPRPFVGGIPQGMGNPDEQASTQDTRKPMLEGDKTETEKPRENFDPATFTMKVGAGTYQHLMTASGKPTLPICWRDE